MLAHERDMMTHHNAAMHLMLPPPFMHGMPGPHAVCRRASDVLCTAPDAASMKMMLSGVRSALRKVAARDSRLCCSRVRYCGRRA